MISRSIGFALLVFGSGCNRHVFADQNWRVEGLVVDARGAPIPHATVSMACPGDEPKAQRATTSTMGRFELWGENGTQLVKKCSLTILATTRPPLAVPITAACVRTYGEVRERPCNATDGRISFL